jgi:hypothetical protein
VVALVDWLVVWTDNQSAGRRKDKILVSTSLDFQPLQEILIPQEPQVG